jgi:SAM-dependent methyltransferase
MGDFNQYLWVSQNKNLVKSPILEIGSKFYNLETSINYRSIFPQHEYFGLDISDGQNVDLVVDITIPFGELAERINNKRFRTIICNSVLEHVDNIYNAAQNIYRLLDQNGVLIVSVPFVWEEHGYPNDYWRFTPNGIKYLFPEINFIDELSTISSDVDQDYSLTSSGVNNFILRENQFQYNSQVSNRILRKLLRFKQFMINKEFRFEYINRILFKRKNLLKKSCINMIGTKV